MLMQRMIEFGDRLIGDDDAVSNAGPIADALELPRRPEEFLKERQSEALRLLLAWMGAAILGLVVLFIVSAGYNVITGHRSTRLIALATAPTWFSTAGAVLAGVRVWIVGIATWASDKTRASSSAPNNLLRWLLSPTDGDLVIQFVCALVVVALELGLRP